MAALAWVACGGGSTSPPVPLRFASAVRVGGLCCLLSSPQLAVDGGRVFVAWTEAIRFTTYTPLRRSTDGGATFPDALPFGDWTRGDQDQIRLATAPGLALDLVWEDTRGGTCDPFCRGAALFTTRSSSGGTDFSPNRPIAPATGGAEQRSPALALAANGDRFVAWQEHENGGTAVRFARSQVGGRDEPSVRVDSSAASPPDQRSPAIALESDGTVTVAWLDGRSGRPEVFVARSLDRGARFGPAGPVHAVDPQVTDRAGVRLAVTNSGRLLALWAEHSGERWRIRLASSRDGARTFTVPRSLEVEALADQTFPALSAHGASTVFAAWLDNRAGIGRLRVARSTDGADTFEPSVLVDDSGSPQGDQRQPALIVDEVGRPLLVWIDFSRSDPGIYFSRGV